MVLQGACRRPKASRAEPEQHLGWAHAGPDGVHGKEECVKGSQTAERTAGMV